MKTPEERAVEVMAGTHIGSGVMDRLDLGDKIAIAIRCAVAEEREACARVCDALHEQHRWRGGLDMKTGAYNCAAAIRARGTAAEGDDS